MWQTGDRVLGQRTQDECWYPGTIRHIDAGRYYVVFDDGEDAFASENQLHKLHLEVGDRVSVRAHGQGEYFPGKITRTRGDHYLVKFENGDEEWAALDSIRLAPERRKEQVAEKAAADWELGDRVLACWFDLSWYPGIVLAAESGQVTVLFDHGGLTPLPAARVRPLSLEVGDRIMCRWKGGPEFYPAKVMARDGEILHLRYDDDDKETTSLRLVRLERDHWLPGGPIKGLSEGDRIWGRRFDQLWYPGSIVAVEGKRVSVRFDDNDQAQLTPAEVKPLQFEIGDRVFCRQEAGPYFPGEIVQKEEERILVRYDEGHEEWTSIRLVRAEK
jgi:hypothetical protein